MPTLPSSSLAGLLVNTSGLIWSSGQFTFSIPTAGSTFSYTEEPGAAGYAVLTPAQAARFVAAIAAWDRLITPNFTQTDDATAPGNIRIAYTDYVDIENAWGYAYLPPQNGGPGEIPGDIWINSDFIGASFDAGSYDYSAMLHEIGHTLGLIHTHSNATFPTAWDNSVFSLMSYVDTNYLHRYFTPLSGGGLQAQFDFVFVSTPSVLDIAAVQQMYGADPTTASGDTVYTFDQSTPFTQTIYDAGGIDTFDLSATTRGSAIDLTPGAVSDFAEFLVADQIAAAVAQFGAGASDYITSWLSGTNTFTWTNNLGIAFSTTIENIKGGSGADRFWGNKAANKLEGNGGADTLFGADGDDFLFGGDGDDTLEGGAGADALDGGAGIDVATYAQATTGVTVDLSLGISQVTGWGSDTLAGIERLTGSDFADTLTGDGLANLLSGGKGDDKLSGGGASDTLRGEEGNDVLTGGAGADQLEGGSGVDTAVFSVASSAAKWTQDKSGTWTVDAGADGIDIVTDVEVLRFSDKDVVLGAASSKTITVTTSYTVQAGDSLAFTGESAFVLVPDQGANASVFNAGNVSVSLAAGASQSLTGIVATQGFYQASVVHNQAGATFTVDTTMGTGDAFGLSGAVTPGLKNDGTFQVLANGAAVGVLATGMRVTNSGTFKVTATGAATGVSLTNGEVINTGTMSVAAVAQSSGLSLTGAAKVTNSGTLTVTDQSPGVSRGVYLQSGSSFEFTNSGVIQADQALAVYLTDAKATTITNTATGKLIGDVYLATGVGVGALAADKFTVINDGAIVGNVRLGDNGATFDGVKGTVSGTVSGAQKGDLIKLGAGNNVVFGNDDAANNFANTADGSDVIYGGAGDDTLAGGGGSDQLYGEADNDTLIGNTGNNLLDGGAGVDTASYATATTGVTVNLTLTGAQNTGRGTDTLVSIENLTGSASSDLLTGDAGANVLTGGDGMDWLIGGAGNDVLLGGLGIDLLDGGDGDDILDGGAVVTGIADYRTAAAAVKVSLAVSGPQNTGGSGNDTLINITAVRGSAYADTLTAKAANSILSGEGGDDVLTGADGDDFLFGGSGVDKLSGGKGSDSLSNAEALISFAVGADMTKAGGRAVIDGGEGTDRAYLTYIETTASVVVNNSNAAAINAITVGGAAGGSITNVEHLVIVTGTGADVITGGAGDDDIRTGDGNDTLRGGGGSNLLNGGAGVDTADYAGAASGVKVDLSLTTAQATGWSLDTLSSIEHVIGSAFADTLSGGSGADTLTGGGGDDTFTGGGGNDTINGGVGIDTAIFDIDAKDAKWVRAANGTTWTVTSSLGTDTLVSVEVGSPGTELEFAL